VVAAALRPFLEDHFGNPSSGHWAASGAKAALEKARGQVAALLGAGSDEIVFTSGGSEANNLALKGVAWALRGKGSHIITSSVEHPAILGPCRFLERQGFNVTMLPVDGYGGVDPDDVIRAITPQTVIISIMHANNEVGTIQPIAEVSRIARARHSHPYASARNVLNSRRALIMLYFCRNAPLRAAPLPNAQGPGSLSPGWRAPPCGTCVPRSTRSGAYGLHHHD
jgi:cysteine sulfinate desulfinase/cysteine desulfurase-like protein